MTARQVALSKVAALLADRFPSEVIHDHAVVEAIRDAAPEFLGSARMLGDAKTAARTERFARVRRSK